MSALKKYFSRRVSKNNLLKCDEYWEGGELPLCHKDFPIIVSWSPKSGCTTLLKWFLAQNNLLEEANHYSDWVHDYRETKFCFGRRYKELCMRYFTETPTTKHIIKVIRDPFKRAVSSYLHLLRYGILTKNWLVVTEVERWKELNGFSRQRGLSFRQFLLFVIDQQLRGRMLDPHLGQQYDKTQDPRVNQFVKIENISVELERIEKEFSLPCLNKNKISNSIHHNKPFISHRWPTDASIHIASDDYDTTLGTPPAEIFYNNDTLVLIRMAYWRDCEAYAENYPHVGKSNYKFETPPI